MVENVPSSHQQVINTEDQIKFFVSVFVNNLTYTGFDIANCNASWMFPNRNSEDRPVSILVKKTILAKLDRYDIIKGRKFKAA